MCKCSSPYCRHQAIADGLLIDATATIGQVLGLPWPIAISAALWRHPEVNGDWNHLISIVDLGLSQQICVKDLEQAVFRFSICLVQPTHAAFVEIQVILSRGIDGMEATFLEGSEDFDLGTPSAGSFYTMWVGCSELVLRTIRLTTVVLQIFDIVRRILNPGALRKTIRRVGQHILPIPIPKLLGRSLELLKLLPPVPHRDPLFLANFGFPHEWPREHYRARVVAGLILGNPLRLRRIDHLESGLMLVDISELDHRVPPLARGIKVGAHV